jgi:hypothetical protein
MELCHAHCLKRAQLSKSAKDRDPDLQLGDLTLEVPGYHSLSQSFGAAHRGFHKTTVSVQLPYLEYCVAA